jgi:hypothetical protein
MKRVKALHLVVSRITLQHGVRYNHMAGCGFHIPGETGDETPQQFAEQ